MMTRILLVEDDKSLREIYGVRLFAEGYEILSASDGEEALAVAIKDRPALILSDVMMPKISGFDMLDILRSTTETKNIKVIIMTALSSEDQRKRGEQLGADRYLVKSQVGIEDVVRTVHEVLGDAPGASNAATEPTAAASQEDSASPPSSLPAPNTPVAKETSETLPSPTAPPSPQRPATLADRIIQPLTPDAEDGDNAPVADLLAKELDGEAEPSSTTAPMNYSPMPAPTPSVTVTPSPASTPIAPPPESAHSSFTFEQTSHSSSPQTPN